MTCPTHRKFLRAIPTPPLPPRQTYVCASPKRSERLLQPISPDERDQQFVGRVWEKAQGLITIRRGDEVMVGNSSEVILNRARIALDAGDIAGAVTAVETLSGQPGQAMAKWVADAKALVDARSALAQLAAQA